MHSHAGAWEREISPRHSNPQIIVNMTTNHSNYQHLIGISKGVCLATIIAIIATLFNESIAALVGFDKSPVSTIIVAILLGMLVGNLVKLPATFNNGFEFSLKWILRTGIVLLGIRLSLIDVVKFASSALPLIIVCISLTLIATYFITRKFAVDSKFAFLTAIGTSICGVTAIVACAPLINANREQTSYAIANITIFGVMAMLLYPSLATVMLENSLQIGYFLGTSIHETSQVAGAGLIYVQQYGGETVLDVATVTKLLRNTFMLLLIPVIAYTYHRTTQEQGGKVKLLNIFPFFIIGFLLMSVLRSTGDNLIASSGQWLFLDADSWQAMVRLVKQVSGIFLTIAMACVGLSTNLGNMIALGLKPFYIGLTIAMITGISSFAFIKFFY